MSFVSVHIPEDGWFLSGCNVLPTDKQLVGDLVEWRKYADITDQEKMVRYDPFR